uniref:Protein kinase domain-containing protein n=1 Tax=Oryza rufipogon TaxID=4529 RepID=A0A0E0NEW7_ORYRU
MAGNALVEVVHQSLSMTTCGKSAVAKAEAHLVRTAVKLYVVEEIPVIPLKIRVMCYFQGNLPLNRMHHPRRLIEAEQGKGTKLARGCCSTSSDFAQKLLLDLRRRRERLGFNSPAPPQSTSSSNAAALLRCPTLPRKGRAASNTFSDCTPPPPRRPSRRGCLSWRPTMTRRASGSSLRRAPPPPTSPRHGASDPAQPRHQERRLASDHYSCVPSSEFDHAIAAAIAAAVYHLTSIRKQPHHHPCLSPEAAAAARRCVEREVAALRHMHGHPHVVGLLDVLATRSTVYLVLKLARGGGGVIATSVSPFPLSPQRARRRRRRSSGGGSVRKRSGAQWRSGSARRRSGGGGSVRKRSCAQWRSGSARSGGGGAARRGGGAAAAAR